MKKHIFTILGMIGYLLIAYLPYNLPSYQKVTLAISFLALIYWLSETIPLFVTALTIPFLEIVHLLPLLKKNNISVEAQDFLAPFGSNIIFLFLGGFVLSIAISKYKLDSWLANFIIKIAKNRSKTLLLYIILTTAFLSMWMSNTATTAMMMIMIYPLLDNYAADDPFKKSFFLGIPFAANIGGMGTPVGSPPNAIAIEIINKSVAVPFGFLDWIILSLPFLIIALFFLWIVLLYFYPTSTKSIKYLVAHQINWSRESFTVILVFFITVLMWLSSKWHHVPSGMVALIPVIIFYSLNILDKNDLSKVSWDILYLVGGGMALALSLSYSGITDSLMTSLSLETFSEIKILIFFVMLGAILTTFMSNTTTANIIIPLIFLIPGNNIIVALATSLAISATMILPVSTPPNAIAYSSGQISLKDMTSIGFIITALLLIMLIVFGPIWWRSYSL